MDIDALIEDYLLNRLTSEEMQAFEELRKRDASIDLKVIELKTFMDALVQYGHTKNLKDKLNVSHSHLDIPALVEVYTPRAPFIIRLWRNNKAAVSMAASFIIVAFVSFYLLKFQQNRPYEEMRRELNKMQSSQNTLLRDIKSTKASKAINPGRYGGTGFALSSNGYICTNYHVINGADSIYVQNSKGASFKVRAVWTDPQNDIAILKIVDKDFGKLPHLPYGLKTNGVGLGERVYTLGFPKDDAVLGEGYVSSKTGFGTDTTVAYQVAISVNPGNSGGPLLDNNGNIVGVISGKQSNSDGAAFAVKSKYILEALRAIPQDSINNKIVSSRRTQLQGLKRTKQIEKIQDYVFMVRVYN